MVKCAPNLMSESNNIPTLLGGALLAAICQAVREEIQVAMGRNGHQGGKPMQLPTPYLTIKEAAKHSRLGESTIRLHIRKRELRAHQVGGRVIIKRADLERFLEAHPIDIAQD